MKMDIKCSKNIKKLFRNGYIYDIYMNIYEIFLWLWSLHVLCTTSFLRHREQVVDYVTIVPYTLKSNLTFDVTFDVINAVVL